MERSLRQAGAEGAQQTVEVCPGAHVVSWHRISGFTDVPVSLSSESQSHACRHGGANGSVDRDQEHHPQVNILKCKTC